MTDRFKWEFFSDRAYWDMCAVRPIGDKCFNSQNLFHVSNLKEGERLAELLNTLATEAEQLRKERDDLARVIIKIHEDQEGDYDFLKFISSLEYIAAKRIIENGNA